jgi:outer membrane lipoprotein
MKRIFVLFGALLLVQGCAYAVSPEMVSRSDTTITFSMLQSDPDALKGKLLILGGVISRVTNTKQTASLEIEQKPLDYWGKPRRTKASGGRFVVVVRRYLDELVYAPGREITVAGEVEGTRSAEQGGIEYDYPVLLSKELKLWEQGRPTWGTPQWLDPLYDPNSPAARD